MGTVTAVYPSGRFGEMEMRSNIISEFDGKPNVSAGSIDGDSSGSMIEKGKHMVAKVTDWSLSNE